MATINYWLVCVPIEGKEQSTKQRLDQDTAAKQLSANYVFPLPPREMKVGTIDQLMQLSDELGKTDSFVEQTVKKLERSVIDLVRNETKQDGKDTKQEKETTNTTAGKPAGTVSYDLRVEKHVKNEVLKMSTDKFVEDFAWDLRRYQVSKGIGKLAEEISKATSKADDDLKQRLGEFNELKSNLSAIERKEGGSLLVKPLGPYVKQSDIYETEYLTTLMIIVPKNKEVEFLQSYEFLEEQAEVKEKERVEEAKKRKDEQKKEDKEKETQKEEEKKKRKDDKAKAQAAEDNKQLSEEEKKKRDDEKKKEEDERKAEEARKEEERLKKELEEKKRTACRNVVPGSAKRLSPSSQDKKSSPGGPTEEEDDEFVLYRVVVMRKGADSYRNLCRDKRYTVRAFKYDPEEDKSQKEKKRSMESQKAGLFKNLVGWCNATYSDIFNAWVHVKAMRLFVEAVLRYGLPINFQAFLLKPKKGLEKKLRDALGGLYSKLSGDASLAEQLDAGETDLSGMGADFYPYVYLPLNLSEL